MNASIHPRAPVGLLLALALAAGVTTLAGCGGGGSPAHGADEPSAQAGVPDTAWRPAATQAEEPGDAGLETLPVDVSAERAPIQVENVEKAQSEPPLEVEIPPSS